MRRPSASEQESEQRNPLPAPVRRLPLPAQIAVATSAGADDLDCRGDAVQRQAGHSLKDEKKAADTAVVVNCQVCKQALDSQTPEKNRKKEERNRKIMQKSRKTIRG